MRQAFQYVWDLNVKAMPISLIWSISFWFIIESPSLPIKFVALFTANIAALACASTIMRLEKPSQRIEILSAVRSPLIWKTIHPIGIFLIMALHNISTHGGAPILARYIYVSIAFSALILWVFATVVVVPLHAQRKYKAKELSFLEIGVELIGIKKRYFLFSILIILLTWPIVFFYVFIALTLSQSIIIGQLPDHDLNRSSKLGSKVKSA